MKEGKGEMGGEASSNCLLIRITWAAVKNTDSRARAKLVKCYFW